MRESWMRWGEISPGNGRLKLSQQERASGQLVKLAPFPSLVAGMVVPTPSWRRFEDP